MDALFHPGRHSSKDRSEKRNSLTYRPSKSRQSSADTLNSPRQKPSGAPKPKIDVLIDSPPLVFYGPPNNSSGALVSGSIKVGVSEPHEKVDLKSLVLRITATVRTKKPVSSNCSQCKDRIQDLRKETLLSSPKTIRKGQEEEFPLSYLFNGGLPASIDCSLATISYAIVLSSITAAGDENTIVYPLKISRALPPEPDKQAIRIFPPTNLAGNVVMPPIMHPIGSFPVSLRLTGVTETKETSQIRWRLRKLIWRLEEYTRMVSHVCPKHAHKIGGQDKGQKHEEDLTRGYGELKNGWKTDFDTGGGEITCEFDVSFSANRKAQCDVSSESGLSIRHALVIELIVSEEYCPLKDKTKITPTGIARVLRMQFVFNVTERAGMGISWDEEMPPTYSEVPASPPSYLRGAASPAAVPSVHPMEDYTGAFDWENNGASRGRSDSAQRPGSAAGPPELPPSYHEEDAFPALDQLRDHYDRSAADRRGRQPRFTADELEIEPPQMSFSRQSEHEEAAEPDVGVGESTQGPPETRG
ncbi:MAG: hypothetical protein Q9227_000859 [Pyrenula ochraceoflavens]